MWSAFWVPLNPDQKSAWPLAFNRLDGAVFMAGRHAQALSDFFHRLVMVTHPLDMRILHNAPEPRF